VLSLFFMMWIIMNTDSFHSMGKPETFFGNCYWIGGCLSFAQLSTCYFDEKNPFIKAYPLTVHLPLFIRPCVSRCFLLLALSHGKFIMLELRQI
jgi:hypothetical protein